MLKLKTHSSFYDLFLKYILQARTYCMSCEFKLHRRRRLLCYYQCVVTLQNIWIQTESSNGWYITIKIWKIYYGYLVIGTNSYTETNLSTCITPQWPHYNMKKVGKWINTIPVVQNKMEYHALNVLYDMQSILLSPKYVIVIPSRDLHLYVLYC